MMRKLLSGLWYYKEDAECMLDYSSVKNSIDTYEPFEEMYLPNNWQLAGLNNFNGTVWFVRKFDLSKSIMDKKLKRLCFGGVDYFCEVWLNDEYLGEHEGYFQKFWFDISSKLKKKENVIVVKVTSPFEEPGKVWPLKKKLIKGIFNHHDCRPGGWSYEFGQDKNTGGIWNDVEIIASDYLFIDSTKVETKIDFNTGKAKVLSRIYYDSGLSGHVTDNVLISVKSSSGRTIEFNRSVVLSPGRNNITFSYELDDAELWWTWDTGAQNLYELKISSEYINEYKTTFAVRSFEMDENKVFYLNGRRLFLRGTNIIPTQFLSDLSATKISRQVGFIKNANLNIVRVHAHVNREEFYTECDKRGILVWQDFPLQWTYDDSALFVENAVEQIKDMVRQYFNHASIAFWCCHNEPGEQIKTLDPFLYDAVLSEDNSRIIRLASNYEEHPYDGWYWGNKEHYASAPMGPLVTEFGAQALPSVESLKKIFHPEEIFPGDWAKWTYHNFQYEQTFLIAGIQQGNSIEEFVNNSQNYQAEIIKTAIDFYRRKRFKDITGVFQFMMIDCWPSITWSVVDYFFVEKKGYYELQKAFQPVYVSIKVRQQNYFPGKKLNLELWIINDLYEEFDNPVVTFYADDKIFYKLPIEKIEKDSIRYIHYEALNIPLPDELKPGQHKIRTELKSNGKKISVNDFNIQIINSIEL